MPLISFLNEEISRFAKNYEFILQVKDEAFKSEHWIVYNFN